MPVDQSIAVELLATCNALGYEIRGVYSKTDDCLSCLKDLIKYLKRDDEDYSVLRQLGDIKVLQNDLLPILKTYSKEKETFDMCLRLLVVLTNPAFLLFKEEVPGDKLALNVYLSIITYLQQYKQAFTDTNVWEVLCDRLKAFLYVNYDDRDEDDRLIVERILIVIRNILHVPADENSEQRTDDDVSIHDQILWAMHLSGIEDLLLFMARSEEEHQYGLHILEIVSLMLREQTPEILVHAGKSRSMTAKVEDEKKLMVLRRKEIENQYQKQRNLSARRFNGSYYVKNIKSISDRQYISHKFMTTLNNVKFDAQGMEKRVPKNRLPVVDVNNCRRSTLSIRLFLKDFCSEFVNNCYNIIMAVVKRKLANKRSENHDDSYYLWAMSYFMDFNRLNNFQMGVVSETVSVQIFHYVQMQIDNYYEMLLTDKKKIKYWSKRIHLGLKAYKELLKTVEVMSVHPEEDIKQCADVIKSNVFYVIEYREMLLTLLLNYDEIKFSNLFLVDLINTTHLFLKMFEKFSKKHSKLVVQKRKRKCKSRKKKQKIDISDNAKLHFQWDVIANDVSIALQESKSVPDVIPFDATSDRSFEDQKTEVIFKIRKALMNKEADKAVSLLRAARELWPEEDGFGTLDVLPEEEFLILREIFLADLLNNEQELSNVETVEDEESDLEENEEIEYANVSEQQLSLEDFIKRFATPKVVQPCYLLLKDYQKNSAATNMSLLKLLYRIAWGCKMYGILFQASVFFVFQKILNDPDRHNDPVVKELARFAKFIICKFFETVEKNKKVFIEMLFWKGTNVLSYC